MGNFLHIFARQLNALTLESYSEDVLLGTTEIEHYSVVEEVRSSPSGSTLVFEGGIEVPSMFVTALRPVTVAAGGGNVPLQ